MCAWTSVCENYVCVCAHVCELCVCMDKCVCLYVNYVCVWTSMCVCIMCVYVQVYVLVCELCVCMYKCVCLSAHVYMWRPEVVVGYLQLLPISFSKQGYSLNLEVTVSARQDSQ